MDWREFVGVLGWGVETTVGFGTGAGLGFRYGTGFMSGLALGLGLGELDQVFLGGAGEEDPSAGSGVYYCVLFTVVSYC